MSRGYVGGMNFYGVKHLIFTRNSEGQITLNVYSDRDAFGRMFTFEFHPDYGTGVPIVMDLPRLEVQEAQS